MKPLSIYILLAGLWSLLNGALHTASVLMQKRPFEKELIRLLIDGHLLMFSGIFYLLCYKGVNANEMWAYRISVAVAVFLLGYCALIFKILPAAGMIAVNLVALVWLILAISRP